MALFCQQIMSYNSPSQEILMFRCLQLAEHCRGSVAPNPMVGALLLHDDRIIGEGFTQPYGQDHAEVNCIKNVAESDRWLIPESTLYVSLEPCSHFGKTPPCVDFILSHQIKKVVIGCIDSAAHVNGAGVKRLRSANVEVLVGVKDEACRLFNRRFFTLHEQQRPYIILKWAQSADGFIAGKGVKTKISSAEVDVLVHKWRTEESGIMVGTNTARIDDPLLTSRLWQGKQPTRIIIDKNLSLNREAKFYNSDAPTIIFNALEERQESHVTFIKIDSAGHNFLAKVLSSLHQQSILSVLIEGGEQLLKSFIDAGLWDECRIITNQTMFLNAGVKAPVFYGGNLISRLTIADQQVEFYQKN